MNPFSTIAHVPFRRFPLVACVALNTVAIAQEAPPVEPPVDPAAVQRGAVTPEAAPTDSGSEWFGQSDWGTWKRATGDWGGARTTLEKAGITFNGSAILEWSDVMQGGTAQNSAFRSLLDLNLTFNLDTMFGLKGGSVFADFQTADTGTGAVFHGGYQAYSNIAINGSITQLSQLWYQQLFLDDKLRLKVGKVDANVEFAYLSSALGFINLSAAAPPTIFCLPTYPNQAMSVNLFYNPTKEIYFGAGMYDGGATLDGQRTGALGPAGFFSDDKSDDYFFIAEGGVKLPELGVLKGAQFSLGGWWHNGDFTTWDGGSSNGTGGFYALAQGRLWAPEGTDLTDCACMRGLWVFGQYGWADEDVSPLSQQFGGGFSMFGPIESRCDDSLGLYVSNVSFSEGPSASYGGAETSLEFYYDIAVTPCFHIKPDLQYFIDPSGDAPTDDALIGTIRMTLLF